MNSYDVASFLAECVQLSSFIHLGSLFPPPSLSLSLSLSRARALSKGIMAHPNSLTLSPSFPPSLSHTPLSLSPSPAPFPSLSLPLAPVCDPGYRGRTSPAQLRPATPPR